MCAQRLRLDLRHVQVKWIQHHVVIAVLIVAGRRYLHVRPDRIAQRVVELLAAGIAHRRRSGDDDFGQRSDVLVLRRQQDTMVELLVMVLMLVALLLLLVSSESR